MPKHGERSAVLQRAPAGECRSLPLGMPELYLAILLLQGTVVSSMRMLVLDGTACKAFGGIALVFPTALLLYIGYTTFRSVHSTTLLPLRPHSMMGVVDPLAHGVTVACACGCVTNGTRTSLLCASAASCAPHQTRRGCALMAPALGLSYRVRMPRCRHRLRAPTKTPSRSAALGGRTGALRCLISPPSDALFGARAG
jgi:hypothetical protein